MDPTREDFDRIRREQHALIMKVFDVTRHYVPAIKDAGMPAVAESLSALYFEYDALQQEIIQKMEANPTVALDYIMESLGRGR